MKGTYQEEEPLMKFSPESALTTKEYQVQQYTRTISESTELEVLDTFALAGNSDDEL